MTSKEILETPATDLSDRAWLKEIAFQLAQMNVPRVSSIQPIKGPEVFVEQPILRIKRKYTRKSK